MARDFNAIMGYRFEELHVGMTAETSRTVTDSDILMFAGVSGDMNPVHMDDEFAATTMFKGRIAHGFLTVSFVSSVLGTKMPGPGAVYVSQTVRFLSPVRPGDTVVSRATVIGLLPEKRRVTLDTRCIVRDKVVLEGEAVVFIPPR